MCYGPVRVFMGCIKGARSDTGATEVSNSRITWLTRLALANALIPHWMNVHAAPGVATSGFIAVHCP